MASFQRRRLWQGLSAATLLAIGVGAGAAGPAPVPDDELIRQQQRELIRQQQRERALQEQQDKTPDVRLQDKGAATPVEFLPVAESPCFAISQIVLVGPSAEQFDWALSAVSANGDTHIGHCLGTAGVNLVMKRLQNAIVQRA